VLREHRDRLALLATLALGGLAGLLLIRLSLGALRDWDLFSAYVYFFLPLAGALFLTRTGSGLPRFSAALLALCLIHSVTWAMVDASPERGLARAAGIYEDGRFVDGEARATAADELAFLARQRGDRADAVRWYGVASQAKPGFWRYHSNRGAMELDLGWTARAESSLTRALELRPTSSSPFRSLGGIQLKAGRPEEALRTFDQGIQVVGPRPELLFARGAALATLGRMEEAWAAVDSSITLDVKNTQYTHWAAQTALQAGDVRRGRTYLRRWATIPPRSPDEWKRIAELAVAAGDSALARVAGNQAARNMPGVESGNDP